jgi:serine protease Do
MKIMFPHPLAIALVAGGLALPVGLSVPILHAVESSGSTKAPAAKIAVDPTPLNREDRMPSSFSPIVKKAAASVVKIEVSAQAQPAANLGGGDGMPSPFGPFGAPDLRRFFEQRGGDPRRMGVPQEHGSASGVIATEDGYILTNNHVVAHANKVEITLHDGRSLSAKVVGTDPKSDLAVVKVEAAGLPAITFADSDQVEVGDMALAAGNPFGLGESVSLGMISATGRATMGLDYEDFLQTDAAINPGNSGGALLDSQGRLIGINTAIVSRSGGNDGIGFAIPANMARGIMEQLIATGKVVRASLGVMVQDLTPELAQQFKADAQIKGALVGDVVKGSPADQAGIVSGDIVTQFAGVPIKDARALKLAVATQTPGEKTEVTIVREGQSRTLTATLESQKASGAASKDELSAAPASEEGSLAGVGVADLDPEMRREAGIPRLINGAIITSVEPGSPSWEAGLRQGDVILQINRQPVTGAESAIKLTAEPPVAPTLVQVWSNGGSRFIVVDETQPKAG